MMIPLSWPLSSLFSQDSAVQQQLWHYLIVVPISYGMQAVCMLLISALNAMHKSIHALVWNLLRLFAFLLPSAWLGSWIYGTEGLFIGIAVANMLSGIGAYLYAIKMRRNMYSNLASSS